MRIGATICYWLLAIGYWLLAIGYWLFRPVPHGHALAGFGGFLHG
jgi:hypothetical protein